MRTRSPGARHRPGGLLRTNRRGGSRETRHRGTKELLALWRPKAPPRCSSRTACSEAVCNLKQVLSDGRAARVGVFYRRYAVDWTCAHAGAACSRHFAQRCGRVRKRSSAASSASHRGPGPDAKRVVLVHGRQPGCRDLLAWEAIDSAGGILRHLRRPA